MSRLDYHPDSEVLIDFHSSRARVKAVCGPPGSGKSVALMVDTFFIGMRQEPNRDNVREIRVGIARKTFRRLKATTRKTLVAWIPEGTGEITTTAPMHGTVEFPHPHNDGTTVRIHYDFMAFESADDLQNLDSYECSVMILNECNEVTLSLLKKSIERTGRFPSAKDGAVCTEPTVLCDFNPQSLDHWVTKSLRNGELKVAEVDGVDFDNKRPLLSYHEQPAPVFCDNFDAADAGVEPPKYRLNYDADNLKYLPPNYYLDQLSSDRASWDSICSRLLMVLRTPVVGKRVHPEFDRRLHVSTEPLEPVDYDQVLIGFDTSGIHPAACLAQVIDGRVQVYRILYGEEMGLDEFISGYLQPTLRAMFPNSDVLAICDPANARDNRTATSPVQVLKEYGIPAIVAHTNQFKARKIAVGKQLSRLHGFIIDGSVPDTECLVNNATIEGLARTYVHKVLRGVTNTDGSPVYQNAADKSGDQSHGIDSIHYLSLHLTKQADDYMPANDSQDMVLVTGGKRAI